MLPASPAATAPTPSDSPRARTEKDAGRAVAHQQHGAHQGRQRGHEPHVEVLHVPQLVSDDRLELVPADRKSTRLNSSHSQISYAVFCLKKKKYKVGSVRTE